jgi:SET and MYND domain-containing protein
VPPELLPLEKLTGFAQLADLQPQIVRTLMLRLRTNAGAIHLSNGNNGSSGTSSASTSSTVQVGCALSSTLSALNHSCEPNATATVQRGWLVVASLKPIQPGEELTICYVDATSPVAKRQEVLREHYNFDCACSRCVRELQKETFGKAAPEGN